MIFYLSGQGNRPEHFRSIRKNPRWGVLLSFKDMQCKANDGGTRFKQLKKIYTALNNKKQKNGNQ